MSEKLNKQAIRLIAQIASIRVYNSAGVFRGPMVKDKAKTHDLVMKARKLLEKMEGK